jgi:segregation and condensation protein A
VEKGEALLGAIFINQILIEYIEYLDTAGQEPPDVFSETILWLARLLALKAHWLVEPNAPEEPITNEPPTLDDLAMAARLEEYNYYFQLRLSLADRAGSGLRSYVRLAPMPVTNPRLSSESSSLSLLAEALKRALAAAPLPAVPREGPTLNDKMSVLRKALSVGVVNLGPLFAQCVSRVEIIVTFLALLELIRVGELVVRQEQLFGEIYIEPVPAGKEHNGAHDVYDDITDTGSPSRG